MSTSCYARHSISASSTSFDGYQSGPDNVILQAYALWDLLVARNIQYSSITASAAHSELVGSQHVRMIEQSINNSQANCVDGSVLWASLMQRIGIDSFLVMEAEHCYAGFYLDPEHTIGFAVETTLVGSEIDLEDVEVEELFDEAISEDVRDDYSFPSFVTAITYGTGKLAASLETNAEETALANAANDSSDKSEESSEEDKAPPVQVIDIPEARRFGILPIAFQDSEEFVWNDYSEDEDTEYEEEDEEYTDEESDVSEDAEYEEEDEDYSDEDYEE